MYTYIYISKFSKNIYQTLHSYGAEWEDYWRILGYGFLYSTYFFIVLVFCYSTFMVFT